jgi:hypothetical protein
LSRPNSNTGLLSNTRLEFKYVTIFCQRKGQKKGKDFPIINAIEGVAINKTTGKPVESSRFLGGLFASHIRDAYRGFLDDKNPRDPRVEELLAVLAQSPFKDPSLKLLKPIFMISRRGDHETSPNATRTESFFKALGMGSVTYNPFPNSLENPQFRYLTFDSKPKTVVAPDVSGKALTDKGFTPEQIAIMSALVYPLLAVTQPHLYKNEAFNSLPRYNHEIRLQQTPEQKRRTRDWLGLDK